MIELRWAIHHSTNPALTVLQFRFEIMPGIWTEWKEVPRVVLPREPLF
jgi:hypothetical protein